MPVQTEQPAQSSKAEAPSAPPSGQVDKGCNTSLDEAMELQKQVALLLSLSLPLVVSLLSLHLFLSPSSLLLPSSLLAPMS